MVGDSNYETNFSHKLLLTDAKVPVSRLLKAFASGSSANIKFQKLNCRWKYVKLGGFIIDEMFG